MLIAPIKTNVKGPAKLIFDETVEDIIDEALVAYRPNLLFKNYDI